MQATTQGITTPLSSKQSLTRDLQRSGTRPLSHVWLMTYAVRFEVPTKIYNLQRNGALDRTGRRCSAITTELLDLVTRPAARVPSDITSHPPSRRERPRVARPSRSDLSPPHAELPVTPDPPLGPTLARQTQFSITLTYDDRQPARGILRWTASGSIAW